MSVHQEGRVLGLQVGVSEVRAALEVWGTLEGVVQAPGAAPHLTGPNQGQSCPGVTRRALMTSLSAGQSGRHFPRALLVSHIGPGQLGPCRPVSPVLRESGKKQEGRCLW